MRARRVFLWLLPALTLLIAPTALADGQHQHVATDPSRLGSVHFLNACSPAVQPEFARAMAMLHSFWYEEAERRFRAVGEKDPGCAMAWWGVAISQWHPLWEPRGPNPNALAKGREAIRKARAIGGTNARERDYVAALETFFADADTIDHLERVLAYERAMAKLHERFPDDSEAKVFYALALLGSATSLPPDKTYACQKRAGELLEAVIRVHPDHPGAAHYLIHAYDYPTLASGALEAARRYAKIAPDSPHAQHMPSHIFTRLGLWDESIASNRKVIEVARKHRVVGEELHAMDYLAFAHLQRGEDPDAAAVTAVMPAVPGQDDPLYFASLYAHAAIPARLAVERGKWAEAARLPEPVNYPGGRYAWANPAISFARALGAARTGQAAQARTDVAKLASFRSELKRNRETYWEVQVEIQRRAAEAWVLFADGQRDRALELARAAAALEDSTDKHPVTPGQIVPARGLLGQMLVELERHGEALAEFKRVLAAEPNRFVALYGAARAAELAGLKKEASTYYRKLSEVAPDSERDEIRRAREFLAGR